jgi:hypothetical protein
MLAVSSSCKAQRKFSTAWTESPRPMADIVPHTNFGSLCRVQRQKAIIGVKLFTHISAAEKQNRSETLLLQNERKWNLLLPRRYYLLGDGTRLGDDQIPILDGRAFPGRHWDSQFQWRRLVGASFGKLQLILGAQLLQQPCNANGMGGLEEIESQHLFNRNVLFIYAVHHSHKQRIN